jgi:hypothetical protein
VEETVLQMFVVLTRGNVPMAPIGDRVQVILDESQLDVCVNSATTDALRGHSSGPTND